MSKKASILGFEFVRAIDCAMSATTERGSNPAAKLISLEMKDKDVIQVTSCDGIHYSVSQMRCEGEAETCNVSSVRLAIVADKIEDPQCVVEMHFDKGNLLISAEGNDFNMRYSASDTIFRPGEYSDPIAKFKVSDLNDAIGRSVTCCIKDELVARGWENSLCVKAIVDSNSVSVGGCDGKRASVCLIPATNLHDQYVALIPVASANRMQKFLEANGEEDASLFVRKGLFEVRTFDARFGATMKATEYPPIATLFEKSEESTFELHEISSFAAAVRTAASMNDDEIPAVIMSVEAGSGVGTVVGAGESGDASIRFPVQNVTESFRIKSRAAYLIQAVQSVRHDRSKPLVIGHRKERNGLHFKGENHDYLVMGMVIPE